MAGLLDPKKPQLSANKPGLSSLKTEESGVRLATAADNAHRSEFTKGVVSSVDKFQSFAGRTARDIGRDTGFKGLQEFGQEVQDRNNAEAELNPLKIQSYEQVTDIDSALDFAGGLAGQAAASLGLAIPGVIAGATLGAPAAAAASLATTAPVLFGESSEDIEERTGKAPSVLETLPAAAANTALEFLPPVKTLKGVLKTKAATKARPAGDIPELSGIAKEVSQGTKLGVAREIGKEAGKSSLYEGATEAAQQLNNILAASLIDDTVDISLGGNASELLNNFLGGAIGGAGFGTMGGVAQAIAASPTNTKIEPESKPFGGGTKTQFDTQEDKLNAANREALRAEIEETRQAAAEGQIDSETASQVIQEAEARIQATFKPIEAEFGKTTKPKPKRATKEQLEALVGETSIEDELTKEFAKLAKAERRESRTKEEEFKDREDRERLMELRNSINDIYGLEEQGYLTKEEADLEINALREEFNQDNNYDDSYDPNDYENTAVEQEGVGTEIVGNKNQRARPSRTPTPTKRKSSLEKRFEEAVKEDSEGKGDDYVSPLKIETHEDIVKSEILEKGITSNEEPAFFKEKADELERSILKTIRSSDKTSPAFKAKAIANLHKERIKGDKEFLRAYSSITRPKVKETALSEQLQNTDDISKLRDKGIIVRANKNFDKTTQIKLPKGDKALDPFQVTVEGMKTSVGSKSEDKGGIPSVERVGTAFFEGLTSLLSNEKNPLGLTEKEAKGFFNGLDDNLVIFRAAGGKKYTVGEFKKLKGNSDTSAIDSKIIKTTKLLQEAKENLRLGKPRTGKTVSELKTTLSELKAQKRAAVEEEVLSAISQNEFSGKAGDGGAIPIENKDGSMRVPQASPEKLQEIDQNKEIDAADPLKDVSVKDRANINAHVSAVLKIQELRQKGVQEGTGNLREEARKIYKETTGKDAPIGANPLQIIKQLQTKAAELTKFATRTPEEKENTTTVIVEQKRNPNKPLTKREQKELEKRTKARKKLAKDAKEKQLQTELNSLNLQLTKLTKQTEINKILKDIDKVTKSLEELRDPVTSKATVNEKGKIVLNKATKRIVKESVSTAVEETKKRAKVNDKQKPVSVKDSETIAQTTVAESSVKTPVGDMFSSSSELQSVGTLAQYKSYLKDKVSKGTWTSVLYHGGAKTIQKFKVQNKTKAHDSGIGIHLTSNVKTAQYYGVLKAYPELAGIPEAQNELVESISTLSNSKIKVTPVLVKYTTATETDHKGKQKVFSKKAAEEQSKKLRSVDVVVDKNIVDGYGVSDTYLVKDPEAIHVLGSKEDVKSFREYLTKPEVKSTTKQKQQSLPLEDVKDTPESMWTVEELSKQENLGKEPQQEQPKESVEKIEKAQSKKKEASTPPDGPITPEDLLAADSKEVNNKLLQQAQSWLKIVGLSKIKIKILSYKEAAEFIKEFEGGVAQHDKIVKGNTRGFVTKPNKDGVRGIFIHPMLKPATMVEVLAHEVGHIIADHILEAMSTKLGVEFNKALLRDFKRWVSKRKLSTNETVESFEGIKGANRQALLAISQTNEKSLSDGQIKYLDKQQEYMADNIATWLLNPYKKPKSAVERLFRLIAFHLKSFINVSNPGAAETVFLDNMYARAPKLDPEINPLDLFGDVNKQLKTTNKLNKATAEKMLAAFHKQVGKEGFKEFQEANHNWSFEQMVMELATLSDADAFGILTHATYKHNLKYTMSPNQKRALNLAAQSAPVQRQLHKILAREGQEVLDSLEDTDTAIAYMYQLWAGGQLNLGNKTTGIFRSIQKFFRHILGIISEDEQAMNVLNDIRNTQSLVRGQVRPNDAIREYVQGSIAENFMKSHGPTIKKWSDKASKFSVGDTQLRRMKIPAIRKIADLIHHIPGAVNKGSNYLRSKQARAGEFHYQMQKIRRGLSKEQRIELNKVLLNLTDFKDHKDPQIVKAVKDTQSLFKGLRAYMMRAGLEVPNLGSNYFPWVLDLQALETDPTGFLNLIGQEKFKEDHERVANLINNARIAAAVHAVKKNKEEAEALIAKIKETGKLPEKGPVANYIKASGGLLATKDVPSYLYNQAINANGNIDSVEEHTTQVPSMRFTNKRLLDFVRTSKNSTKEDREAMTSYVNQNAEDVMTIYTDQAVKRAEYTRYFGAEGEVLNDLIEKAKKQGATEEEIKTTLNYVNGTLGTLGKDTAKWLNEKLNVPLPENTNSPINRKLQKAMGAMLVFQNIRLLALATFSSAMDPLGIAVRTGSVSSVWKSFKVAAIGIKGETDRKTQIELSAMLGVIDLATSTEAIRMEYGGANLGAGHLSTINDKFFKLIQIERFTRFTRVMAVSSAQEFIKKHTGKNQTKDSVRYMQELSLQEGDVSFNEDGTIKVLTMEERFEILEEIRKGNNSIENKEILAKDDRVRNAVQQFVDDSILRPNPAIRPIWGSDPHFMLIMHLKSFTYAFYEKVLKRAALEIDEDNLGSLFGIMLMIPVIAMADFLKDTLRGKDNTAVRADWGLVDYVGHYAERAGLLGLGTFAHDAVNDVKYGSLPGTSYAGATYDILTDIVSGKAEGLDFLPASTALRYRVEGG